MMGAIQGDLKDLTDEKAALISDWMEEGKIARCNPYHLLFSIWSLTQHYADFDVQVRTVLDSDGTGHFPEAEDYLETLFSKLLSD
jgi:TetR/AcrR family transcriptional regulator